MSSTQISFASFAQAQLAPAPITVQAEPEHTAVTPFKGPYKPWKGLSSSQCTGEWRGAWFIDWQADGNLDAPERLPSGGHIPLNGYEGVYADGYTWANRSDA